MQIRFGTFTHDDGTCSLSISKQALRAQSGTPYAYVERWTINGILLADDGGGSATAEEMIRDLKDKSIRLEAAYKQTGVDVELVGTNHIIKSSSTVNGVQVIMPPSYPMGENAEHVTYRTFQVGLEAEVLLRPGIPFYLSYEEHIRLWGGGPERAWTMPITGTPRRLTARSNTVYWGSQAGMAVAYNTSPQAPAPIFGAQNLMEQNPRLDYGRSMRPGERSVSWEYLFASSSPLNSGGIPQFFIPTV